MAAYTNASEIGGMLALSEMPLPCRLAWLDDQQDFSPQLTLQLRGAALEYVRYGVPEQRAQRAHRSLSRVRDLGAPQDMLDRLGGALAGTPQQVQDSMQRLTQSLQPGDRDTLLSALRSLGAQTMNEMKGATALSEMPLPCRMAWLDDQQHFSPQLAAQLRGPALESVRDGVPQQRAQQAHRSLSKVRALGVPREVLDRLSGTLAGSPVEVMGGLQRLMQSLQPGDRDALLSALRSLHA